jgi:uncharacterized paraquat-inducible protein A
MTGSAVTPTVLATTRRNVPMMLVDCPLCDTASPFDADDDALDCPRCDVRLDLARDEAVTLAEAA